MDRPERLAVTPVLTAKTSKLLLPLTASRLAPGPLMLTLAARAGRDEASVMVAGPPLVRLGANSMVSLLLSALASVRAARRVGIRYGLAWVPLPPLIEAVASPVPVTS